MELFVEALLLLKKVGGPVSGPLGLGAVLQTSPSDVQVQARDLLLGLGYLEVVDDNKLVPATRDLALLENRQALLQLASRLHEAFELALPYAPGARFFGGVIELLDGQTKMSVGGRGETFVEAFESCIGEAAECRAFIRSPPAPYLGPLTPSNAPQGSAMRWALDGIGARDVDPERLQWVPSTSLLDLTQTVFPAELVFRVGHDLRKGKRVAESAGVAAGATKYDALLAALLEVVERDAAALWWFGHQTPRLMSSDTVNALGFSGIAERIRGDSERPFWMLDITSDLEIPAIVSLSAHKNGGSVIVGLAAGVTIFDAMKSAFLEMCQMELAQKISTDKLVLEDPDKLKPQDRVWLRQKDELNLGNYPRLKQGDDFRLHSASDGDRGFDFVLSKLAAQGFHPHYVDLTLETDQLPVVRVLVPGLQSAKVDWVSDRMTSLLDNKGQPNPAALAPF